MYNIVNRKFFKREASQAPSGQIVNIHAKLKIHNMRKRKAAQLNQRVMTGVVAMGIIVLLVAFLFLSMVSCTDGGMTKFHLSGHIRGAADSTLYVEAASLQGIVALDSCRLGADGAFSFDVTRDMSMLGVPDSATGRQLWAPEFYRLRLGTNVINFVVDSTEAISVEAPLAHMSTDYDIQGNEASRTMKTLSLVNIQLQQQLHQLDADATLSVFEKVDRARELHATYKQTLKQDYILRDPSSPAAYFALFQTLAGQMLFNPATDRNDVQFFAAVATQWEEHYPHALRTENLRAIALRGLSNTRQPRPVEIELPNDKVRETGIIDMGFPDISGRERRLSELSDNVVLLDFTSYSLPESQQRTLLLRELYDKYHSRGLEIYQVALDADEHRWQTMVDALPWVSVRCAEGFANDIVMLYRVNRLPTFFIIGRGSELRLRDEQIDDLNKAIEAEL